MFETIKSILMEYIEVEEVYITEESRLQEDLFLNSLDYIYIIMDLEKRYNIVFPDEAIGNMRTVRDILKNLEQMLSSGLSSGQES